MRRQGGFTVVEVLVAMAVLGVVALGAMTMIEVVMRQGRGVLDRTDAAQRGRLVLDQITRQVRSQVCLNETTKGLVSGDADTLTFYADLSASGASPVKRQLRYDGSSRNIVERTYQANGTTVAGETVLLANVVPSKDPQFPEEPPPFFTYWAYSDVAGSAGTLVRAPNAPTTAQLARVSVIKVNFAVRPHGAKDDRFNTALSDQVVLRNADPNATNNDPTCK